VLEISKKESGSVAAAPILSSIGAVRSQDATKAVSQINLSLLFIYRGITPDLFQPSQPQIPAAMKTN
jgi:hypothetical protein